MPSPARTSAGLAAAALLAAVGLTACSSSSSGSTAAGASGSSSAGTTTAGSCGTVPSEPFTDSSGVISTLGSAYSAAYSGYSGTVTKSAWASWKPTKSSGFTVAFVDSSLGANPYQALLYNTLQKDLAKDGYTFKGYDDATTVTQQLSEFNTAVADKVDLIIYQPLASGFNNAVDAAAKAGIPSISVLNNVVDPNTVNVVPNAFEAGEAQGAAVAKIMGSKGTILGVHGIQGVPIDTETFAGAKAALALCPNITLKDSIYAQFSPTVAQTDVSSYLAANPTTTIGGVLEGGPMTTGIIQAFQKEGETVPTIADNGLTEGGLYQWKSDPDNFVGLYNPGDGLADAAADVAQGMLSGDGVKVSDIVIAPTLVTGANFSDFASAAASGSGATVAQSDVNQPFASASYLGAFFSTTPSFSN